MVVGDAGTVDGKRRDGVVGAGFEPGDDEDRLGVELGRHEFDLARIPVVFLGIVLGGEAVALLGPVQVAGDRDLGRAAFGVLGVDADEAVVEQETATVLGFQRGDDAEAGAEAAGGDEDMQFAGAGGAGDLDRQEAVALRVRCRGDGDRRGEDALVDLLEDRFFPFKPLELPDPEGYQDRGADQAEKERGDIAFHRGAAHRRSGTVCGWWPPSWCCAAARTGR